MLFIAQEKRLVDECLFYCLFYGLQDKCIICKHLFSCPLSAEYYFAMQSDHLFLNRTQLLYFFLRILLSVSVTRLIYNQTKKKKVTVYKLQIFSESRLYA